MKHIQYTFTDSDIQTILFTLSVLPTLSLEDSDVQAHINLINCESASEKLIEHRTDFTANEFRVIYGSLMAAQQINQGILDVDGDTKLKCCGFLFSINKLVSAFDSQMR